MTKAKKAPVKAKTDPKAESKNNNLELDSDNSVDETPIVSKKNKKSTTSNKLVKSKPKAPISEDSDEEKPVVKTNTKIVPKPSSVKKTVSRPVNASESSDTEEENLTLKIQPIKQPSLNMPEFNGKISEEKNDIVMLFKTLINRSELTIKAINGNTMQLGEVASLALLMHQMSSKLDLILHTVETDKGGFKRPNNKSYEDDNGVEEKVSPVEKNKPIHTWFKEQTKNPEIRTKLFALISKNTLEEIKKTNAKALTELPKNKNYDDVLSGLVYLHIKNDKTLLAHLKSKRQEIESSSIVSENHEMDLDASDD